MYIPFCLSKVNLIYFRHGAGDTLSGLVSSSLRPPFPLSKLEFLPAFDFLMHVDQCFCICISYLSFQMTSPLFIVLHLILFLGSSLCLMLIALLHVLLNSFLYSYLSCINSFTFNTVAVLGLFVSCILV
jgi:hypothetical protein